ncbi:MAG: acylphosphatase, partial [Thaumarchaeota archaeon]|nr:acylphosphatase [Nitrososphaerota archaeon]
MSTRGNGLEAQIIRAEGAVQRVGFRRFAEKVARSSKIAGYVENLKDGSVRIFAQGASEGITQFIDSIKKAPQPIIVDNILTRKATVRSRIKYFRIKTGSLGTEIQEGFGAMESQFGDYRSEFK